MMDDLGDPQFDRLVTTLRRKRSQSSRRPKPDAHLLALPQLYHGSHDLSSPLEDENMEVTNSKEKILNLNQCISRCTPPTPEGKFHASKKKKNNGVSDCSNVIFGDGHGHGHDGSSGNKFNKVKLKVGGVTRTIVQARTSSNGLSISGASNSGKGPSGKQSEKPDSIRKSKKGAPKRRDDVNETFNDEEDDEIRYLVKLKTSRIVGYNDFEEESCMKKNVGDGGRFGKDGGKKKSRSKDTDYEEEPMCDFDSEPKKKKQRKDAAAETDSKRELALTTRQKALLSSKDPSGASQVEFPDGLPPPPSRKQKEKLTEVEQQLKKAEAAQRRKIQNEKAAKESEAEAIRKILGQDSSRKKREDKNKKRQEEIAQEKAAAAKVLALNTVRWHMGPNGTVVTFSQDMGLPQIFQTEIRSYPPPREKCIGPLCTNPYKYRDSKSKLPLCSLHCYKAIQAKFLTEATC